MGDTYLMVCAGQIIDILFDQTEKPNWPPDINRNPVESILYTGEVNDEVVRIGMMYENGEIFNKPMPIPDEVFNPNQEMPTPTNQELMEADAFQLGVDTCILELIDAGVI